MFQHTGAGHGPLFGHMAHNEKGDPHFLGKSKEHSGCLSDLGDTAGRGRHLIAVHGLDGINDNCLRLFPEQNIGDGPQIGLTQKAQGIRRIADPRCAEFDLPQ